MSEALTYEDYLDAYGSLTYTVVGVSMLPLLRQGRDLFTATPKGSERCRVGEVVLYRRPPSHYVLHRVVEVRDGGYLILGDNCLNREWVPESDIIAVMCSFVRKGHEYGVDCLWYRAYTWFWVHAKHQRVTLWRAGSKLKRLVARTLPARRFRHR